MFRKRLAVTVASFVGVLASPLLALDAQAAPTTVRINAGGGDYTDTDGRFWQADRFAIGGEKHRVSRSIKGTQNDSLYQTERWGMRAYRIPVRKGTYLVKLRFAEINAASGRRVMDVTAEGVAVRRNLNLSAEVGNHHAYVTTNKVAVSDGMLDINFAASSNSAKVSAIEVVPAEGSGERTDPAPPPTPPKTTQPPRPPQPPADDFEPDGPGGNWNIAFRDEFDGDRLDTGKWKTCYDWGCNLGSQEIQWYQPQNVSVGGGRLHLVAKAERANGYPYSSGMVQSNNKFNFKYGYFEMRAKLPRGDGLWPAFWAIPQSREWPPEIDVMEAWDPSNTVRMTYHWGNDRNHQQDGSLYTGPDFTSGFHTFGLEWTPDAMTWYIDGVPRKTFDKHTPNMPMYLVANLAIDSNKKPTAGNTWPADFEVDWIRAWRR